MMNDINVRQWRTTELQQEGRRRLLTNLETDEFVSLLKDAVQLRGGGLIETLVRSEGTIRNAPVMELFRGMALTLGLFVVRFPINWETLKSDSVSAVIGGLRKEGKLLGIKNLRGWDFPGGHVEHGESPEEALIRECMEEGSVEISNITPILTLEQQDDSYTGKIMIFYMGDIEKLLPFSPHSDSKDRALFKLDEFKDYYFKDSNSFTEFLVGNKGT